MCKDRALHHEENLSALRSYIEASGLFHEDADFNPLVKIAEHLFVLGLPVFYQVAVDDAFVWKRSRPFTMEISTATVLWLQTKRTFSSQLLAPVPFTGLYTQWYCIQNTLRIYGHGLTAPYYQSFVTSKKLQKIGNMYANIKYYMMKITNTSWWLQEPSRNVTTEYIRRLKTRIIFPPHAGIEE
ncbi:hypothetical protein MRX96_017043 [Rhipicephalus microplus]